MREVEWVRLKAGELAELAKRDGVVIVPVASTEQHGPHLPTGVDVALCGEIALRAARQLGEFPVAVTPVVWTGLAEHHMAFGGTFSLGYGEFYSLIRGVCRSLRRHGFRRILLLNGHGGNTAALTVAVNDLAPELDAPIATATYWELAADAFGKILEHQPNVRHACEAETSMMLAIKPDLVDMAAARDVVGPTETEIDKIAGTKAAQRWRSFRARTSHGVIGDPRSATPEKGEKLLEAAAMAVAGLIANDRFWNAPAG